MRVVNGILCAVLIAFAALQYNDPDVYFWMPVYAVAAAWAGLASWRPERLTPGRVRALLGLTVFAAVMGTAWLWPTDAGFWHRDVWWQSETAREGIGMMVVTVALVLVVITAHRARRRAGAPGAV